MSSLPSSSPELMQDAELRAVTSADAPKERLSEWFLMLRRLREPGEDILDTSTRLLLTEAVRATSSYSKAGELLGMSAPTRVGLSVKIIRLIKRFAPTIRKGSPTRKRKPKVEAEV